MMEREKRESKTPLRHKSIPYVSGFFFFQGIFSSFSFSAACDVMKAMGTQTRLNVYLLDATNLKKCHFISNVSIQGFLENKSVLESPQSATSWLLLASSLSCEKAFSFLLALNIFGAVRTPGALTNLRPNNKRKAEMAFSFYT